MPIEVSITNLSNTTSISMRKEEDAASNDSGVGYIDDGSDVESLHSDAGNRDGPKQVTFDEKSDPYGQPVRGYSSANMRRGRSASYSSTRGGMSGVPLNVNPFARSDTASDHQSFCSVASVLHSISFMSHSDRATFLKELSSGQTLSNKAKISLLDTLARSVIGPTTIILNRSEEDLVVGLPLMRDAHVANFAAKEFTNRTPWAIQQKTRAEIHDGLLRGMELEAGDTPHATHRWLIIPSGQKLFAYENGLQGLTENHRQEEMKIMEEVAIRLLIEKANKGDPSCNCKVKYTWSNDFSACEAQVQYTVKTCVSLAFAGKEIPEGLPWNELACAEILNIVEEEAYLDVVKVIEGWEGSIEP